MNEYLVLVVEDDKPIRNLITTTLKMNDYRFITAVRGNEAIMLLKDSSLVSAIGLTELAFAARTVACAYSRYWEPYITISFIYLIMTQAMAAVVERMEKKYKEAGGMH